MPITASGVIKFHDGGGASSLPGANNLTSANDAAGVVIADMIDSVGLTGVELSRDVAVTADAAGGLNSPTDLLFDEGCWTNNNDSTYTLTATQAGQPAALDLDFYLATIYNDQAATRVYVNDVLEHTIDVSGNSGETIYSSANIAWVETAPSSGIWEITIHFDGDLNVSDYVYHCAIGFDVATPTPTVAVTDTITNEASIRAGGDTVDVTLSNDTWIASFSGAQQDLLFDAFVAQASPANGWNNTAITYTFLRVSNTVVRFTLDAAASYDIASTETIDLTVDNSLLITSASDISDNPAFTVGTVSATRSVTDSAVDSANAAIANHEFNWMLKDTFNGDDITDTGTLTTDGSGGFTLAGVASTTGSKYLFFQSTTTSTLGGWAIVTVVND